MNPKISTASLRVLITLAEKREKLSSELSAIETQIAAALAGTARPDREVIRKIRRGGELGNGLAVEPPKKRGKRGATKELILETLKAAGAAGISVKELSAKLGMKNPSVHVWFNTTGKKLPEIEKTGKGIYRLNESGEKAKTSAKKSKTTGKK